MSKFKSKDLIQCPHCGIKIDINHFEMWNLYEEEEHYVDCVGCSKEFAVNSEATYTFESNYIED